MPTEMIMTETAGTEEAAALSPLPGSPNQNNNGNGEVKPMEVDNAEKESPPRIPGGGASANGVAGPGTPAAPSPSLLNTPKSAAAVDCFKTPDPRTPTSSSKKRKRLTPEEKNLRERERLDKRRKLEEEKQKKEEERLEKARQKEAERLKKEEEKRRSEEEKKREREKKEEERKKIEEEKRLEREKKEEERKRLEEEKKQERLKKEEERKKKDDERRQKLEEKEKEQRKEEEKKEKERKFFTNFFQKAAAPKVKTIEDIVNPAGTGSTVNSAAGNSNGEKTRDPVAAVPDDAPKITSLFVPFQIKTDMGIAPLCRRKLTTQDVSVLDAVIQATETCQVGSDSKVNDGKPPSSDFLKRLKHGQGRRDEKTVVVSKNSEAEIQILDDEVEKPKNVAGYIKWRVKLLQFHENRRPAYWGTWKRKAKKIKARRPLVQEEDVDYDFDSDDEWEDEPEDAEEIGDSDKDEKDDLQEEGDGEDDEEGWMVPHGYLSDTEREGPACDIASMKSKEKEFYKSLKDKTSIGWPFIDTHDLACYTIRICPVFRSADPVKPVRKRAKPVKKEPAKEPVKVEVKPAEDIILDHGSAKCERKSKRSRKVPDNNNPYAKPPSGFLAMNLPSDDEEDMDYDMSDESSSSSSSESSGDDEMEEGKENGGGNDDNAPDSDDSLEDLFIPIKVTKTKKSPSSS